MNLLELKTGGKTDSKTGVKTHVKTNLKDVINQSGVNFNRLDAQQLIAYINLVYPEIKTRKKNIEKILNKTGSYNPDKMKEYLKIKFDVSDNDIIQLLKRNGIDINDFGYEFNFIAEAHKQYSPALDPQILNPDCDNDLLERYKDYYPSFVLDPLIFEGGYNIIGAERGTGKTRFCLSLAYNIIFGGDSFLGYPLNCKGHVLYINMEIPERDFKFFIDPIKAPFLRKGPELFMLYTLNTLSHQHPHQLNR